MKQSRKGRKEGKTLQNGSREIRTDLISGDDLANIMALRSARLEKDMNLISNQLKRYPAELKNKWLDIQLRNKNPRFYQMSYDSEKRRSVRKYLPKAEKVQIEMLAQQTYDRQVLKVMEQEREALAAAQKAYAQLTEFYEDVYGKMGPQRQALVTPIIPTAEQKVKAWLAEPYQPLRKYAESATYLTEQGEYVRSKSELMIADRLYHAGIPYKYECPLEYSLEPHAEPGSKSSRFYPDFTIFLPEQEKELYWEHFGLMSDADYLAHAIAKLSFYQRVGLLQSGQLILTFEAQSTNLDPKEIAEIIERIRN